MELGENMDKIRDLSKLIENNIKSYINNSSNNSLGDKFNEKAISEPLVGFSKGSDPYYEKFKVDIGDFYWTPLEAFKKVYPEIEVTASELTVICWVMPYAENVKNDHNKDICYPAERLVRARINGEKVNLELGKYLKELLINCGYEALIPSRSPSWKVEKSEKYVVAANWSEKHAAFVSGLGTFGLSGALITKAGIAVRLASVIAKIPLQETKREYTKYNEYCLFYSKGVCKKCIERCPSKSISEKGHNKIRCKEHINKVVSNYMKEHYDTSVSPCGLCQTRVPCQSSIPLIEENTV
jgi:epoxyqueuosine reductase QueG